MFSQAFYPMRAFDMSHSFDTLELHQKRKYKYKSNFSVCEAQHSPGKVRRNRSDFNQISMIRAIRSASTNGYHSC